MMIEHAAGKLMADSGIAIAEARLLLACVLGVSRESLVAHPGLAVPASQVDLFRVLCLRRQGGEPIAYLTGEREFFGRSYFVDSTVLVPRPETEELVQTALELLAQRRKPRVLDLGTGCGCIAITLALERPDARVWASDISPAALRTAARNAAALQAQLSLLHSDWYAQVPSGLDLIVSNPPYVAALDPHLAALAAEPRLALTDEGDGMDCLRAVIAGASARLADGGTLVVEHGFDQAQPVRRLMEDAGLRESRTRCDLAGLPRVSLAHL